MSKKHKSPGFSPLLSAVPWLGVLSRAWGPTQFQESILSTLWGAPYLQNEKWASGESDRLFRVTFWFSTEQPSKDAICTHCCFCLFGTRPHYAAQPGFALTAIHLPQPPAGITALSHHTPACSHSLSWLLISLSQS